MFSMLNHLAYPVIFVYLLFFCLQMLLLVILQRQNESICLHSAKYYYMFMDLYYMDLAIDYVALHSLNGTFKTYLGTVLNNV